MTTTTAALRTHRRRKQQPKDLSDDFRSDEDPVDTMNTRTNPLRCKNALNEDNRNEHYRDEAQIDEDHRETRPQLLKNPSDVAQIFADHIDEKTTVAQRNQRQPL